MKKAIYIWAFCLVGLLFGVQSFGQRGHGNHGHRGNGHVKGRSFKKGPRHFKKGKSIARYHHPKRHVITRNHGRSHYGGHSYHRPVRRPSYRATPWAVRRHYNYNRHVYFPDYHAFYDARRRGYVYRNRGRWIFTHTIPSFMVGINWNNVRLQYLQGVPVTVYPQTYYDTYVHRYPAVSLNLNVHL